MLALSRLVQPLLRLVAVLCAVSTMGCATAAADGPAPGDSVTFFPSYASRTAAGEWRLAIQGRVYDPDTANRGLLVRALGAAVHVPSDEPLFLERARLLVSDSSRNTRVTVRIGQATVRLPPSDPAGYFAGELTLPEADVMRLASRRRVVPFQSLPAVAGGAVFAGEVLLLADEGLTVITDMDDTIKVTDMLDATERNANTFSRPFRAVDGMAALYRGWQAAAPEGIHFHMVSAGPWQLHEPLRRFTRDAGFPDFTWDMRSVDLTDLNTLRAELQPDLQRTYEFKVGRITDFMERFPGRHVVLVGDSGERDPEVYATIVARFPQRVDHVFIRNVRAEEQADRYARLYATPAAFAILRVFRNAQELPPLRE